MVSVLATNPTRLTLSSLAFASALAIVYTMRIVLVLAAALLLTGCPAKDDPPVPRAETAQQALDAFADAVTEKDARADCAVMTEKLQKEFALRVAEAKLVQPREHLCSVAFIAYFDHETSLGRRFEVRATTVFDEQAQRARGEVEWRESEPGDGMGVEMVKRGDRWLISRF